MAEKKWMSGIDPVTGEMKETPKRKRPMPVKALAVGGIALVVIGALVFMLLPSGKEPPSVKPVKKVETKKPVRIAQPKVAPKPVVTNNAPAPVEKPKEEFVKRPGALQLPNGKVLTFPPPAEGQIRKVYANGHTYECDHLGNFKDITKRKLFKSAFELNFLGLACEGKPYIPAFLVGLDKQQVQEYLSKPYQPIGDETEEELAQLKSYDEMRQAAINYIAEGGDFDDFVTQLAQFDRKQRETRAMTLRETMMLYKQGKIQEAKDMADASNLLLKEKGFKAMKLPTHVQEAFDRLNK